MEAFNNNLWGQLKEQNYVKELGGSKKPLAKVLDNQEMRKLGKGRAVRERANKTGTLTEKDEQVIAESNRILGQYREAQDLALSQQLLHLLESGRVSAMWDVLRKNLNPTLRRGMVLIDPNTKRDGMSHDRNQRESGDGMSQVEVPVQ